MGSNDHEINRGVRAVLARHWVDLTKTAFASRRGIVRLMGEMRRMGPESNKPLDPGNLEVIDHELRRVRGVSRVHFDLANWRRNSEGEWEPIEEIERRQSSTGSGDVSPESLDGAGDLRGE